MKIIEITGTALEGLLFQLEAGKEHRGVVHTLRLNIDPKSQLEVKVNEMTWTGPLGPIVVSR